MKFDKTDLFTSRYRKVRLVKKVKVRSNRGEKNRRRFGQYGENYPTLSQYPKTVKTERVPLNYGFYIVMEG